MVTSLIVIFLFSTYCSSDKNSNEIRIEFKKAHADSIGCATGSGLSLTGTIFFPPHSEEIKKLPDQYNVKEIYSYASQIEQYAYNYGKKSVENENYIKNNFGQDWMEKVKNKCSEKDIDCIISFCFVEDKTGKEYIAIDTNNDEEFTNDEIYNFINDKYKIRGYDLEARKVSTFVLVDIFVNGKIESIKIPIRISKSWQKGSNRTSVDFVILEAKSGILNINNKKYKMALFDGGSIFYSKYSRIFIDSNQNGVFDSADIYSQLLNPFTLFGHTYEATDINSLGKYIIIQKTDKSPPLQKGMEAPNFDVFTLMDSSKIKLSDYKGEYVLLDFWASYCGPCLDEIKTLKDAYIQFKKKGFEIISIGCCDKPENIAKIVEENEISWTQVAIKENDEILKMYQVNGLPTYYLINPNGKIAIMPYEFRINGIIKSIEAYIK